MIVSLPNFAILTLTSVKMCWAENEEESGRRPGMFGDRYQGFSQIWRVKNTLKGEWFTLKLRVDV